MVYWGEVGVRPESVLKKGHAREELDSKNGGKGSELKRNRTPERERFKIMSILLLPTCFVQFPKEGGPITVLEVPFNGKILQKFLSRD